MRILPLAVLASLAAAPSLAQELKLAIAAPATSMDPHFYNAAPNNSVGTHFFDRLVNRTPEAKLDKNPLLDKRVRLALSMAINRQGLAERVMQETYSAHWISHGEFSRAVANFVREEQADVRAEMAALMEHSPFRKEGEVVLGSGKDSSSDLC